MSAGWILVVGTGIVLALPLAARAVWRSFDPFEPIVVFALAWGVMFVARPASMLAHHEHSYFGVDIQQTFPLALLLGLTGAVAFACGYGVRAGSALARALPRPREITTRAGIVGAAILLILSLVALVVMFWPAGGTRRFTILLGGQTYEVEQLILANGSYPFMTAMLAIPAAILLLALALRERRRGLWIAAAAVFAFALVLTVPLGARTYLLPLAGGALTLAYVSRGARPRALTLVAFGLAAFVASYAVLTVREPARRRHLSYYANQFVQSPWVVFTPVIDGEDAEMAPVLAGALRVVPSQLHYRYGGALFGDLLIRPIPRPLWPGKPQPSEDQVVRTVWPALAKDRFQPAFSPLLAFYWDFSIAGVFVGMTVLGVACRTLYEWFRRHSANLVAQAVFAIGLWLVVAAVRYNPVQTLVLTCVLVLPLILVGLCSTLRWPTISLRRARAGLSQK